MESFKEYSKNELEAIIAHETNLPEFYKKELNEDQSIAFDSMNKFLRGTKKMFLFQGYAGTGKTFTLARFINYIKNNIPLTNTQIAMTATTNKAVKVLRGSAVVPDGLVAYATIHSLLGLKEHIDADGKISFVPDKGKPRSIEDYDLIIIDESSMLSTDIFKELLLVTQEYGKQIIFVGDSKQIPPVADENTIAIPFNEEMRAKYKIDSVELTQIVRQKEGNPIIELATKIRERPFFQGELLSICKKDWNKERGGILAFNSSEDGGSEYLEKLLERLFVCDSFKQNPDYAKVLAWRNVIVDKLNEVIRGLIYPEDEILQRFYIGEKLLANTPVIEKDELGKDKIVFSTNDEFEVVEIAVEHSEIRGEHFKNYLITVESTDALTGEKDRKDIRILHEDSEEEFNTMLELIAVRAKKLKATPDLARAEWRSFYELKKVYADVKYNYAVTTHKSQGSTYTNTVVLDWDLQMNRNVAERNKIKYTACTRAAKTLVIVG